MGKRRDRLDQRVVDQKIARAENGPIKVEERARRDKRMLAALKAGKMPYGRIVRNWLCVKLQKKESQLTEADVQKLLTG